MNLADYKNIWVFIETECGKPKNVGFELINAAKPLAQEKGCELIAVVIGKDIEGVAKDAICYGADSAIIVDGPEYEYYTTDAFAKALVALVEKYKPETLMIGATDMGTGCDTILSQMAADCLDCSMDEIVVHGVDTDISPYDCGSYASSTTYVTGMAVMKTCETLRKKISEKGAKYLGCPVEDVEFDGEKVLNLKTGESISRKDIGNKVMCFNDDALSASEAFTSPVSPPPFMVGMAEVEIDKETGAIELIDYAAVVDCGTVVNPNLARVQTEGGIAQGIGMAMYEDIVYSAKGKNYSNSFMQYKIPSRLDVGTIRVEFESSYEPTGPFGAKSIGEIVINTPSPAIANAVDHAVGVRIRELPITSEKIFWGIQEQEEQK